MPSISDALGVDLSGYQPVEVGAKPAGAPTTPTGFSPFMRSPLPPIWQTPTDSLNQFKNSGVVPSNRIFSPATSTQQSGNSVTNEYVSGTTSSGGGSSSSGGSGSGSTTNTGNKTQSAVSTGTLSPNAKFRGVIQIAKAFQLLSVTASNSCRIQLYGSSLSQSVDYSRALDVSPPAGSTQGIICDLALDTNPYTWQFQNRNGQNADSPQSNVIYITVTNLSAASVGITVTFVFVPLEN